MIVIIRRTVHESIKRVEHREYSVQRDNYKWVLFSVFEIYLFGFFLIFKSKKEIDS